MNAAFELPTRGIPGLPCIGAGELCVIEGQNLLLLDSGQGHERFQPFYLLNLRQGFEKQLLIRRQVLTDDLQEEIGIASNDIALCNFLEVYTQPKEKGGLKTSTGI